MAFVNEDINTPERIREFDAFNLISPITGKPPERWKWTVDRERGFYLISFGGGALEIPRIFALVGPNGVIEIRGDRHAQGRYADRSVQIEWQISAVRIPRSLASQATVLMSILREALTAHGTHFNSEPVKSVQISLPRPTFV